VGAAFQPRKSYRSGPEIAAGKPLPPQKRRMMPSERQTMKTKKLKNTHFHHVAISVRDMDRALTFYRDLLGFELEWELDHVSHEIVDKIVGLKEVDVRLAMLSGYGTRLEFFSTIIRPEMNAHRNASVISASLISACSWKMCVGLMKGSLKKELNFTHRPKITAPMDG
jgi:hypothetical protein